MYLRLLFYITLFLGITAGRAQEQLDRKQIEFNSAWSEAIKYYLKNDYENALSYTDKALKYNKSDAACYFLKGKIYARQANFELAVENYKKANKLSSDNIWYLYYLAQAYFAVGDFSKAIDLYKKVIELQPYQTFFYQLLDKMIYLNKYKDALEIAKKYENYYGFDLKIGNYYIKIYGILNDTVNQIATLEKIIQLYPNSKQYINLYLNILKINDNTRKLLEFYKKHPDNTFAQLQIFEWYLKTNNLDSALILISQIIKSNDIEIKRKLIALHILSQKVDKNTYLELLAKLYKQNPSPKICLEYSEELINNLLLDSSVNILLKCTENNNYNYDIYPALSLKLVLSERLKTADTLLYSALSLFPNQPDIYSYLALIKALLGDYKKAQSYLNYAKTMDFDGQFLKLHNLTTILLTEKSNKTKAQNLLDSSIVFLADPKTIALYISVLSHTNLELEKILKLTENTNNPYIILALARYYLNKNKTQELKQLLIKYPALNYNKSLK